MPYLEDIVCKKKILYLHGIWNFKWDNRNRENIHNILSKIYNNAKWRYYYTKIGKYVKHYDTVIQLHEKDDGNLYFRKHYGIESVIMENAADDVFFEKNNDSGFRQKYNLPDKYLLCVANYCSGKNQEMVLRAYYKSNTNLEMIFVGKDTGNYVEHLEEIKAKLESKNNDSTESVTDSKTSCKSVQFMQDIPREEIPLFVRHAKIFLFGSIGEKFPMSIVEPMASGVPFISTDVGIVRYFSGGLTVKINDVDNMALKIDWLLNDDTQWNRLSVEGADFANKRMRIEYWDFPDENKLLFTTEIKYGKPYEILFKCDKGQNRTTDAKYYRYVNLTDVIKNMKETNM